MSQTKYYVRLGTQLMGPFSLDQLKILKERGRLQPFHSISTDGRTWQPASSLTELFPPEPPPASANPAASVAPGAPLAVGPEQDAWYYLDANGQQAGPVPGSKLLELYRRGVVNANTFVWKDGLDQWVPLGQRLPWTSLGPESTARAQLSLNFSDLSRWLTALRVAMIVEIALAVIGPILIFALAESSLQQLFLSLVQGELPPALREWRSIVFCLSAIILIFMATCAAEAVSILVLGVSVTKKDAGTRAAAIAGSLLRLAGLLGIIVAFVLLMGALPATFMYAIFVAEIMLSGGWFLILLFFRLLAQDVGSSGLKTEFGYQMLMYAIASTALLVAEAMAVSDGHNAGGLARILSWGGFIAWLAVITWTLVCLYRLPRFLGHSARS